MKIVHIEIRKIYVLFSTKRILSNLNLEKNSFIRKLLLITKKINFKIY